MLNAGLGFQRLQGVRDQLRALGRLTNCMGEGVTYNFIEPDITDMFWNIPKDEVLKAIFWSCATLKGRQRCLHLSTAKQGLKRLDRYGKASSKDFFVFSEVELLRFVEYDIYSHNLFTIGPLIMHQGAKGVPIGGFVSAHIAELWAMWR